MEVFDVPDVVLYYQRSEVPSVADYIDKSITKLKLGSIYRSKKIKGEYRFILIQKDKKFFFLQTDKTDYITIDQIKSGDIEGKGSTFWDSSLVYIENGLMFVGLEDKQIEELSPTKFRYFGADFELQE
jgi:hypothetical protein